MYIDDYVTESHYLTLLISVTVIQPLSMPIDFHPIHSFVQTLTDGSRNWYQPYGIDVLRLGR